MVDEVTELDFFALDIETDNSDGGGLDPGIGQITAIALLGKDWLWHQQASSEQMERAMLVQFADALVWSNRPIIATWNGGAFDFPFLTQRMEHHGVGVPWVLSDRTDREPKYAPPRPTTLCRTSTRSCSTTSTWRTSSAPSGVSATNASGA